MQKRILAILGSPHKDGRTGKMLNYAVQIAKKNEYAVDYIHLYDKKIAWCSGCRACMQTRGCVHKDDIAEIAQLLKTCDIVILAAPVYWANVPAIVKNMFDRLLGTAMEDTRTFPKPRLSSHQKYILLTACNTPAPFSRICGQSSGSIRSMKEFLGTAGMKYVGKCVWTGQQKSEIPKRICRKLEKYLAK